VLLGIPTWCRESELRVFEIEYRGKVLPAVPQVDQRVEDTKYCAQSIRLLREVGYDRETFKMPSRDSLDCTLREEARNQIGMENPRLQELQAKLVEVNRAFEEETRKLREASKDIQVEINTIQANMEARVGKLTPTLLATFVERLENELAALPVRPLPCMSLEKFAEKNRLKLVVRTVDGDMRDVHTINGGQHGPMIASLAAKVSYEPSTTQYRAIAAGDSYDNVISLLCRQLSGRYVFPNGVVLPDGNPYSFKAPPLLPKILVGNAEAEKEAAEQAAAAKETEKTKFVAKAKKIGKVIKGAKSRRAAKKGR
jgi:hypothetical protein